MKNRKLQNYKKRLNGGFTLIETLVAIFILLIAVTGPLAVAQSGLRAAFLSRDQTTAFYLAQDAFEYVKNVRDGNILATINGNSPGDWLYYLRESCEPIYGCTVDTTVPYDPSDAIESCVGDAIGCNKENPLKFNTTNKTFGFGGDEDSIFTRKVFITETENREAEVLVEISWTTSESLGIRTISVRENIFNWIGI
jgi:prepilin-type N-terminal cleavage/methylation domain-containing protein